MLAITTCQMDLVKESGFTSRPPFLDGTNYGYWKARMLIRATVG